MKIIMIKWKLIVFPCNRDSPFRILKSSPIVSDFVDGQVMIKGSFSCFRREITPTPQRPHPPKKNKKQVF